MVASKTREQRCFRVAFDFLGERLRTLDACGPSVGFWDATHTLIKAAAEKMENDPLAADLLTAGFLELERRAERHE